MGGRSSPGNALFVWELSDPTAPTLVGQVGLALGGRSLSFDYDANWLQFGYALSGDLPLTSGVKAGATRDHVFAALDDAMPDNWGRRAMIYLENPKSQSHLDFLYYVGDHRFGALGFSLQRDVFSPHPEGPLPELASIAALANLMERIQHNDKLTAREKLLVQSTKSMGGAHPKALLWMDGAEWVAKFPRGLKYDSGLIEYCCLQLASDCGINAAESALIAAGSGHIVATKRFDRIGPFRRRVLSAKSMLLAGWDALVPPLEEFSYAGLVDVLRLGGASSSLEQNKREIFRRMAYNILIENTDDHEKNHAFIHTEQGWELSPAYDLVPLTQGLAQQQFGVGKYGAHSTLENALSACARFGMTRDEAVEEWFCVAAKIKRWKDFFSSKGVTGSDIDYLSTFLDSDEHRTMRSRAALDRLLK